MSFTPPSRWQHLGPSLLAVGLATIAGFVVVAISLGSLSGATEAFAAMVQGAFGDWGRVGDQGAGAVLRPLGESGTKAAMLTLTGLSVAVAFRVGLFNIGAQGQLVVGALAAAMVGAHVALPAVLHLLLAVLAGVAAGAAWASIAGWLKTSRGVHEVISTIMLNWVAVSLVESWLVPGPLRAPAAAGLSVNGTPEVAPSALLPRLLGESSRLNLGFVLAVAVAVMLLLFLGRTVRGYEWRAVGLAPDAAEAAGIGQRRVVVEAMAVAGACAGLAGAVLVLGTEQRYPGTINAPWGFDGIAMALLGAGHPMGVLASSLWFGALRAGGTRLQLFGVHKSFPELMQGFALLLVAAKWGWQRLLARRVTRA